VHQADGAVVAGAAAGVADGAAAADEDVAVTGGDDDEPGLGCPGGEENPPAGDEGAGAENDGNAADCPDPVQPAASAQMINPATASTAILACMINNLSLREVPGPGNDMTVNRTRRNPFRSTLPFTGRVRT
jgi:hypothetical protein